MASEAVRRALAAAGRLPTDLRLIVNTSASRDYLPSWSVAIEIARLLGTGTRCLGLDLTAGCVGALAALELARTWLAGNGGGCAAIAAGERWAHTIARDDPRQSRVWSHSDGAGAVIATTEPTPGAPAFLGACFHTRADLNDHVLVEYGGTRNPVPPPGQSPHARRLSTRTAKEILAIYRAGYQAAFTMLCDRFACRPTRLVCNQVSPKVVEMLREICDLPAEAVITTGPELGHQGAADVLVALERLPRGTGEHVAIASSAPYAFGFGALVT
jgi:3-oxoacyl-[acyl-carrier-protein] synthase III